MVVKIFRFFCGPAKNFWNWKNMLANLNVLFLLQSTCCVGLMQSLVGDEREREKKMQGCYPFKQMTSKNFCQIDITTDHGITEGRTYKEVEIEF